MKEYEEIFGYGVTYEDSVDYNKPDYDPAKKITTYKDEFWGESEVYFMVGAVVALFIKLLIFVSVFAL